MIDRYFYIFQIKYCYFRIKFVLNLYLNVSTDENLQFFQNWFFRKLWVLGKRRFADSCSAHKSLEESLIEGCRLDTYWTVLFISLLLRQFNVNLRKRLHSDDRVKYFHIFCLSTVEIPEISIKLEHNSCIYN